MIQQAVQVADTTLRAQVFSRIDALGAKLGVAADHIWPVLVRQSYADAAMDGVLAIAAFVLIFKAFAWSKYWFKEAEEEKYGGDFQAFAGFVCSVLTVGCVLLVVYGLGDGLRHLINPEYYALQSVLDVFRGGK